MQTLHLTHLLAAGPGLRLALEPLHLALPGVPQSSAHSSPMTPGSQEITRA